MYLGGFRLRDLLTVAMAQSVIVLAPQAEGRVFESQSRQTLVWKV